MLKKNGSTKMPSPFSVRINDGFYIRYSGGCMKFELSKNIGELLEKAANENKDKTVIHFHHENLKLSYSQLNKTVNQYANTFRKKGIQKGDHIGVMLSNCPEFPYTWLALAKLGAVIVPLNNGYQSKDLEYVLNNSDSTALVIEDQFVPGYNEIKVKTPNVKNVFIVGEYQMDHQNHLGDLAADESDNFTMAEVETSDMINIQYTSGTTGMPKGCMLTHEYWLLCGACAADLLNHDDVFLTVTPFYYMDPQWQLIMTLTAGTTLIMTKKYSSSNYMKWICDYKATVSWGTMAAWTLKQPESKYDTNHKMRFMFVGAFPAQLQHQFENRFNVKIRETFGMTEIGPGMMIPIEDDHMSGSGSVGKPLALRQTKIVDELGNEVKTGEIGQLLIKGQGIFKGYYKNSEATAGVFEGDWFKTGDLFKQDEQGYYYIVGRIKDMIRRSGENISAKEVEDTLTNHPKIKSAAVVPVSDGNRGEEVKAYIVPLDGETPESIPPETIIEFCAERIANFKIPRYIEYCKTFPLTPTGKIRKQILLQSKEDLTSGCFDRTMKK